MRDGWRLALGTLTVVRTPPPRTVTPAVARTAMLLAPLAALPLAAGVVVVLLLADALGLPPLAGGLLGVAVLALGTRCLHLDGLSDVADGLTAGYDAERSLAVMRSGASGPAGTTAVVLVVGLQACALAALGHDLAGALLAGLGVALSRCALWIACAARVPAARGGEGLGATVAGVVPRPVAGLGILLLGVVPGLVVVALVARCRARLGGITGDVLGAGVELACAGLLLTLAALA